MWRGTVPDSLPPLCGGRVGEGKLRRHPHHRRLLRDTSAAPSPPSSASGRGEESAQREGEQPHAGRGEDHFSGSANTQSTEPLSGLLISGTSVPSDFKRPDPLPEATATYCLPLTL
jgi:hypothetical protein